MITFIGNQRGEDGSVLRSYFSCRYSEAGLPPLPWGSEGFDCVLVSCDHAETSRLAERFADEIARCAVDWVQTTGPDAERIHDLVDEASVSAGRQARVGDGSPMTSWHEDATSIAEIAEVAYDGLGGEDRVLCVIVGSDLDEQAFRERLAVLLQAP